MCLPCWVRNWEYKFSNDKAHLYQVNIFVSCNKKRQYLSGIDQQITSAFCICKNKGTDQLLACLKEVHSHAKSFGALREGHA